MGADTRIEWADHTFNPWIGCTKVSPACDHCYAEVATPTRALRVGWGPHAERRITKRATWAQPFAWHRKAAREGRRHRVFSASLADVFDNAVPLEWLVDLLDIIRVTDGLDWLLLTKRPQLIRRRLEASLEQRGGGMHRPALFEWIAGWLDARAPGNVWLGTTVENQAEADRRIPHLLAMPAARRFLSCEPLLGPLRLDRLAHGDESDIDVLRGRIVFTPQHIAVPPEQIGARIDWVIAGGESGPQARPSHPDWFRSLRDQCVSAGVPFFFKQWGEWKHARPQPAETPGRYAFAPREYAGAIREIYHYPRQFTAFGSAILERIGKKAAGATLDGREWREVPA